MKQRPAISLSIPQPCTENWDAMTPTEQGRQCASCDKTVIDFTGWTDAALAEFFSRKRSSRVCGRLNYWQLERALAVPHQPHSKLYRWVMAAGISAIVLTAAEVKAQSIRIPADTPFITVPISKPLRTNSRIIQGVVTDYNKEPLINATVIFRREGVKIGQTFTDIDGAFSMEIEHNASPNDTADELEVNYFGYISQIANISRSAQYIPFKLKEPTIKTPNTINFSEK